MAVLSARDLVVGYEPARPVLSGVSLELAPREFLAVVGPSGGGKSTLLRALAGLLPPLAGSVAMASAADRGARPWAMVFQEPRLFPWRRVVDNVTLGLEGLGLSRDERRMRALDKLSLVGLAEQAGRWPGALSGGQRQRVGIARALAVEPAVLLMDEPFSALDAITRRHLQQELTELRQRTEAAVVFVTHDIEEAVSLADRVMVLGGRAPASVEAVLAVDLPLTDRRHQPGFRDRVRTVEGLIHAAHGAMAPASAQPRRAVG